MRLTVALLAPAPINQSFDSRLSSRGTIARVVIADAAFQAGQIIGFLILALIVVGLARTFMRSDLTWREKILGSKKSDPSE